MVHSGQEASIPVADMSALIALLEASEVGSYVLDEIISAALCKSKFRTCIAGLPDEQGGLWMYEFDGHAPSSALRVTQSLDAALALSEMVLPGWLWDVTTITTSVGGLRKPLASVVRPDQPEGEEIKTWGYGSTPALALCIATLKAKAQGEGG